MVMNRSRSARGRTLTGATLGSTSVSERLGEEGLCRSLLTGYRQYGIGAAGSKRCPEPRDRKALVVEKRAELLD